MRRVFADTYYWIALLNDRDQGHAAARAISHTLPQPGIVTTQEVLSEVLTYLSAHGRQVRQVNSGVRASEFRCRSIFSRGGRPRRRGSRTMPRRWEMTSTQSSAP